MKKKYKKDGYTYRQVIPYHVQERISPHSLSSDHDTDDRYGTSSLCFMSTVGPATFKGVDPETGDSFLTSELFSPTLLTDL